MPPDIEQKIKISLEERDLKAAQKLVKELSREQRHLSDEFKDGKRSSQSYLDATRDLTKKQGKLENSIRDVTGALDAQTKSGKRAAAQLAASEKATERFDKASQGAALAGDVESNLRTVGGAAGALGGSAGAAVEKGVAGAGELFAVVEAAPRLKAAFAGMPSVLASAAASLGPGGLIAVGLAAGAAAAVAAWKHFNKAVEEGLKSLAAASGSFVDFAAGGGTAEGAQEEIVSSQRRIEFAQAEIARLEGEYANRDFTLLDRTFNEGEQAIADQIKEFKTQIGNEQAEITRFTDALTNGELPAAAKEVEAATSALTQAQTAAVASEKARSAAIQESTKSLAASTEATSRFSRAKIGPEGTGMMQGLSFAGLAGMGKTSEQTAAENDAEKERAALIRESADKEMDLRQDMADQRFNLELDNFRDIKQLNRDFNRSEADAQADGNFLQLTKITRDRKRAAEDQRTAFRDSQSDITRGAQKARRELEAETTASMRELNAVVGAGLNGVVSQFQNAMQRMSAAFGAKSGFGSAPRTG